MLNSYVDKKQFLECLGSLPSSHYDSTISAMNRERNSLKEKKHERCSPVKSRPV